MLSGESGQDHSDILIPLSKNIMENVFDSNWRVYSWFKMGFKELTTVTGGISDGWIL